jgi:hypothetical protein
MLIRSLIVLYLALAIPITTLGSETQSNKQSDGQNKQSNGQYTKPPEQQLIEKLLVEAGLDHLAGEDKDKVEKLLTGALAIGRSKDKRIVDIAERAERYFESEGYKPYYLKVVSVRGEGWLVVSTGLVTSATKDLPMMFPTFLFKEGYYFCKPALMGGITEMIDDSGNKQTFMLAEWKEVR